MREKRCKSRMFCPSHPDLNTCTQSTREMEKENRGMSGYDRKIQSYITCYLQVVNIEVKNYKGCMTRKVKEEYKTMNKYKQN